tara:strand:+ start:600 stop:923 length:324 start_codon:yes stop_codon:yes gene_type:complete
MSRNDEVLKEMFAAALAIGPVEWGSTGELSISKHLEHTKASIKNTAENFGQTGKQSMHGLYVEGSKTVLCHTGTSPNSPTHARILTALWNSFVSDALSALEAPEDTI